MQSKSQTPITLTKQQENFLIGLLLGDGNLRICNGGINANLNIGRQINDKKYNEYLSHIFLNLHTKKSLSETETLDKRSNKIYRTSWFRTKSCTILTEYFYKWYKEKRKTIPNDLFLNSEIIGIWFCDDGNIAKGSTNRVINISFATNSFNEIEVNNLKNLLSNYYNTKFSISKRNNKNQFTIHGANNTAEIVVNDIKNIVNDCSMNRKLDIFNKRNLLFSQKELENRFLINSLNIGKCKLLPDQIKKIKELFIKNISINEISKIYCVSSQTISNIINCKSWKNL